MDKRAKLESPAISVIVTCYNTGRWLSETLASCEAQTFTDFECIIVLDGCTDDSPSIADKFVSRDPRFSVLSLAKNQGPGSARNIAVKMARGGLVGFLDGDDVWETSFLETLSRVIAQQGQHCVGAFSRSRIIDERSELLPAVQDAMGGRYDFFRQFVNICPQGNGSCLLLKRDALLAAGEFLNGVCEDADMWLRILKSQQDRYLVCVTQFLARYRRRQGSLTTRSNDYLLPFYSSYLERHLPSIPEARRWEILASFARFIVCFGNESYPYARSWAYRAFRLAPAEFMKSQQHRNTLAVFLGAKAHRKYIKFRQEIGRQFQRIRKAG